MVKTLVSQNQMTMDAQFIFFHLSFYKSELIVKRLLIISSHEFVVDGVKAIFCDSKRISNFLLRFLSFKIK
ncbi:hypothetical protein Syun_014832 [Stephania yunnanensis]|uniref:Uncharacterized protein n=1 Tax=Stephania yunnanensis TaxID=152371 RepID=A0AAP0P956_9MAGN